ncbi:MAG TPA: TonB-dependent receptor, partial [Oceanipulchritudo sp.]|nr:TonB-dependent receptor [Oceanipulchritudo sp.]
IEPLFIREATILKGSAALFYGGEAIGGAVDVQPDYVPVSGQEGEAELNGGWEYGTAANARTGHLRAGHGGERWALRMSVLYRDQEDMRIPGFARTPEYDVNNRIRLPPEVQGEAGPNPEGTVPNTFVETGVLGLGGGWFEDGRTLTLAYQHYGSRYGVPLDGHTHGNPPGVPVSAGPSPADGVEIDLEQNRFTFESTLDPGEVLPGALQVKAAFIDFVQKEFEGAFLGNDFSRQTGEGHLLYRQDRGVWRTFFGAAAEGRDYRNRNISYAAGRADADLLETRSRMGSLFALQEIRWKAWAFRMGMRGEWQTARRRDRAGLKREHAGLSVAGEILLKVTDEVRLILAGHQSNRLPTPEELFIEAPHGATGVFQLPDPELGKERSRGVELTLESRFTRIASRLTYYYRTFDQFIFQENQGFEVEGLTAYAFVQEDATFKGAEFEIEGRLWVTDKGRATLSLFGDWIRAETVAEDEPLPRIPPARLGIRLDLRQGNWHGGLAVRHAFAQSRVPRSVFGTLSYQSPTPAHTLVSVNRSLSLVLFGWRAEAGLRVENLFDEEARQHTSFLKDVAPLPGRNLSLFVKAAF